MEKLEKPGILKKSWKSWGNIFEAKNVCKILEKFGGKIIEFP